MAKWYVKNPDGKVFGPVGDSKLVEWAKDGRIEPFAGLSTDLAKWTLASIKPELEMDWLIENEPGRFYGPTNRCVVDDLIRSGSLAANCRIYRDDHGGEAAKASRQEVEKVRKTLEDLRASSAAEISAARDETAALRRQAEALLAQKESELAALRDELAHKTAESDANAARAEELRTQLAHLTESKKREWTTAVVEPEIVSAEPPPSSARAAFAPGRAQSLADLERQAQSELARMGATGAKRFFGFRK